MMRAKAMSHTDLVELDDVRLDAQLAQQLLRSLAVRAVALGEDGDGILVDNGLRLGLCCRHGAGTWGAVEEAREERNGGGWVSLNSERQWSLW
jgi:hypothetical protein